MRVFFETYLGKGTLRVLLTVLAVFFAQFTWGDQYSLVPIPPMTEEVNWILGPTNAQLGDYAKIQVPEGMRYTDAKGVRLLLQRMRNPVPQNVVGLVAPDSGKWWVVLDCSEVGYLKELDRNTRVDASSILKAVRRRLDYENAARTRQGGFPIASVDWVMAPVFDPNQYTIEWSLRAETPIDKIVDLQQETETNTVINHTIRLIGRNRVLGLTAVQAEQASAESIPLKELTKNISFNKGARYIDYRPGDKLAKQTLQKIIVGEDVPGFASSSEWLGIGLGVWIGAGAGALLILVGGTVVLVRRSLRRARMSRAYPDYQEHDHALSPIFANGKGGANGARRRRTFNYQKYYSDMMQEVSSGPLAANPTPNGKRVIPGPAERVTSVEAAANETVVRGNLELIAHQTRLIEEQKRLLQEQGKLIEEKNRLIQEKGQLLEKQAELLERNLV